MKSTILAVTMLLGFPGVACPIVTSASAQRQLVVDDDKIECPFAQFSHIQNAVNAASPGDSIRICKGTYVEQASISKALNIKADFGVVLSLTILGQNLAGASALSGRKRSSPERNKGSGRIVGDPEVIQKRGSRKYRLKG
jgi:pectin methylesterase-like acyl-CoA thioesterase